MAESDGEVLEALVRAVCPDPVDPIAGDVLAEAQRMIGALAPHARRAVTAGLVALDQLARLSRWGRGRRFARLGVGEQRRVLEEALDGSRSPIPRQVVAPLRALVVTAYYDHPDVRRSLGYTPEEWVAGAIDRRLRIVQREQEQP